VHAWFGNDLTICRAAHRSPSSGQPTSQAPRPQGPEGARSASVGARQDDVGSGRRPNPNINCPQEPSGPNFPLGNLWCGHWGSGMGVGVNSDPLSKRKPSECTVIQGRDKERAPALNPRRRRISLTKGVHKYINMSAARIQRVGSSDTSAWFTNSAQRLRETCFFGQKISLQTNYQN